MAAKWKLPTSAGFTALINSLKQTKKTSEATASGVSALQGDLLALSQQTASAFSEVDSAFQNMDAEKADKGQAVRCTIPVEGWGTDASVDKYPKYYDITAQDVTAKDMASVVIAPTSLADAFACGICSTSETLAGKIRIRASVVPTAAIVCEYWVHPGKEIKS